MPEAALHVGSGKVRELYALDDERLLLVASDRISTFDVVLPTEIPDKGCVLTGLSGFWFARTSRHLRESPARAAPRRPLDRMPAPRDAADRVRRARLPRRLRLEGLQGDRRGLRTRASGRARPSRTSCRSRSSRRRRRRRRATTRTSTANRRPSSSAQSGSPRSSACRSRSTASPPSTRAAAGSSSPTRSSSSASTTSGELVLGDEALTPDSSRFWPADEYRPGGSQPSFDKQFVRDYCESTRLGQDRSRSGAARRRRHRHARSLRRGVRAI